MMELHFYNMDNSISYEEAKAADALFTCDAPAHESEVDRWGFDGGALCDAMQAVVAALRCTGMTGILDAVLVGDDGEVIAKWSDDA